MPPCLRFRVVSSGSSGNATLVEGGGARILIDAGLGPRELAERLDALGVDPASIDAVVLSHEHNDHAKGAASFSRKWGVRLVGTRGTYAAAGFGAVTIAGYEVLEPGTAFRAGRLSIQGIPIPHDAAGPMAFVVSDGERCFAHATDLGHVNPALVAAFRSADAVLIESNYDPDMLRAGPYPWSLKERILSPRGHLSNGDVARYLAHGLGEACRAVVLAHLSQKNNHPEVARMAAETALARRGRSEVRLVVSEREGTDWVGVGQPAPALVGPRQMRLF